MSWKGEGNPKYRHGGTTIHRLEYNSWRAMVARCNYPKYWAYHRYGGRGIKVCDRWLEFENFLEDMGKKPSPKHTIDRIDNNGNYTPENCQWSSVRKQRSNTSRSRLVEIDGITKTMAAWCRVYNRTHSQIYNRLREGWTVERALKTPLNPNGVNFR